LAQYLADIPQRRTSQDKVLGNPADLNFARYMTKEEVESEGKEDDFSFNLAMG
jgi:hypothetical protein